jgi:hypothetical protein
MGRLVDENGKPRADVALELSFRPKSWETWLSYFPEPIKTGPDGQFRFEALLPGYDYRLSENQGELRFGGTLRLGQTKDLGDVQMKEQIE